MFEADSATAAGQGVTAEYKSNNDLTTRAFGSATTDITITKSSTTLGNPRNE